MIHLNIVPFKVIALGNYTELETVLPLAIAVLERGYRIQLQLVGYGLFSVRYCPKMTSFEVHFHTQEEGSWKDGFTRIRIGRKAMTPDLGDYFGDKMKVLANERIMILPQLRTELWRTFKRILYNVTSYRKWYKYRATQTNSLIGVLSAVQDGDLIYAKRY
ncbi:hypothetical protein AVEN_232011-1 [Araneus ventricosus]|uniref:Uncharacterized protein n=1 Tax=Araneus ventricosus TaxID=182803 RepID=A0A4Y2L4Q6_ARAVE|nr:hypothetical protein AVEN_232011-1 [Araneus ventricosus]